MRINRKIFNKVTVILVFILLLTATAFKIHSLLTFPKISDWNYYNLQKIVTSKDELSFAVFGDNKNSITTFERIIDKINKEYISFAVDVGDLVYDGEKEKFGFFIKQIEHLNKPFLTVIGNHETKEGGRVNYYKLFGRFYYSFTIGNSYFIVLDDANERNLDPWQMDWLKEELKKSQDYKYRFVFMHVPLFDPRKSRQPGHSMKDVSFAKKLNRLFDQYNTTMLFASHIHGYYRGIWGKTPYIITGGAGAEMVGTDPAHYFYHYIRVSITDEGVKYYVVRMMNPDFEFVDRVMHSIWIYITSFFAIHFLDSILIITLFYLLIFVLFELIEKRKRT